MAPTPNNHDAIHEALWLTGLALAFCLFVSYVANGGAIPFPN